MSRVARIIANLQRQKKAAKTAWEKREIAERIHAITRAEARAEYVEKRAQVYRDMAGAF